MEIAETLNACSISMIDDKEGKEEKEEEEEDQLMSSNGSATDGFHLDNTVVEAGNRLSVGCMMENKKNNSTNCPHQILTIPSLFSFELREAPKGQRDQANLALKAAIEKIQKPVFKRQEQHQKHQDVLWSHKKTNMPRLSSFNPSKTRSSSTKSQSFSERRPSIVSTKSKIPKIEESHPLVSKIEKAPVVYRTFVEFVKPKVVSLPTEKTGFLASNIFSKPQRVAVNIQKKNTKPGEFSCLKNSISIITNKASKERKRWYQETEGGQPMVSVKYIFSPLL